MSWIAKTTICHPDCPTFEQGKVVDGIKPALLRQFAKDGVIQQIGDPDEPIEGFEEEDALNRLDRQGLLRLAKSKALPITPMKSWTDQQLRTTVRQLLSQADLDELSRTPAGQPEESGDDSSDAPSV
jgi:hypothetical protein